jgi:hypothetical protein
VVADPAPPGAFELLERVRRAYRAGAVYHDRGRVEIHSATGTAPPWSCRLVTASGPGGFSLALYREGETVPERALWRRGEEAFELDGQRGQYRPVRSLPEALGRLLPAGGLDALPVPALLLGADPLADPEGVAVEPPEPCRPGGGDRCWVLVLSRLGGALESRLWVDEEARIHRGELLSYPLDTFLAAPRAVPTRVVLELTPTAAAENPPPFEVPAGSRRVVDWEGPAPEPPATFHEELAVTLLSLPVRVVATDGTPVSGLAAADFRVTARRGRERTPVPLQAVDWISSVAAGGTAGDSEDPLATAGELPALPLGKRLVIFAQSDVSGFRVPGFVRLLPLVEELVDGLPARDRVAVVAFDSHLKLWHDFTRDHGAVKAVLRDAVLFGGRPPLPRRSQEGELGRHFDRQAAVKAATPEKALELLARALEPLPGEKEIVYLGWGLGRFGANGVRPTWEFEPAVEALLRARATVHVLDVSQADFHSLEEGLKDVAQETGGTYQATFRHPELAARGLARMLTGYYLLRIDRQVVPAGSELTVELAEPARRRLFYRPITLP